MRSWYLVYSKPQQERVALENLARQGYVAYLPLVRVRRRRQTRVVNVVEPMFPRYLFVHLSDRTDDWGPIRSTVGVACMVRFGDEAARVPEGLIEAMRAREDEEGLQVLDTPDFRVGDRVRIAEGALAGYEAMFQARSGKQRVILLLEVAGKLARVEVNEDDVEPTEQARPTRPHWT